MESDSRQARAYLCNEGYTQFGERSFGTPLKPQQSHPDEGVLRLNSVIGEKKVDGMFN